MSSKRIRRLALLFAVETAVSGDDELATIEE
jgi:hypothetical protein